jgi:erythromycin esterase-like protein
VLSIETPEGRRMLRGLSERLRFDSIVIEFDWP